MKIERGYNAKVTGISINARLDYADDRDRLRMSEVWIEQEGIPEMRKVSHRIPIENDKQAKAAYELFGELAVTVDQNGKKQTYIDVEVPMIRETLGYATLQEVLDLRDECNRAIQQMIS